MTETPSIRTDNFTPLVGTDSITPDDDPPADLPTFNPISAPNFRWGKLNGEAFARSIDHSYKEIVHWRRNLFKIPSGKAGKAFVQELTRMFRAYSDSSALECVALKAAMIMPALLLQKPHQRSKTKDHILHLERRLQKWSEGDLESLMKEGYTIQQQLSQHRGGSRSSQQTARVFAKLMMEGKVRAALRLISEDHSGCPLNLDGPSDSNPASGTVREIFMKKHPPKQPPKKASIVQIDPIPEPHPILFDQIDGVLIRHTALRMDGAAGPSGLDSAAWKRMCTSFKSTSADLCEALASIARRICSSFVDPKGLSAFVACRLIALDKCPGVRPIGIGETVRRIIGKAIAFAINDEIKDAAGPLQLCAGHISGCEAAVHAMRQVFEAPETDAVILVDASNAFNSLNRQTALRNVQHLCPAESNMSSITPSTTPGNITPSTMTETPSIRTDNFTPLVGTDSITPDDDPPADLPTFNPISAPNFRWGKLNGEAFARSIDHSYKEIVHWRRNLFKIPSGKAGKAFVQELTRMFRAYSDSSALECVALKAAMIMPALLLQKPHQRSKTKDHILHLERRLQKWSEGDLESLMKEGYTIQQQLSQHRGGSRSSQQTARVFAKLMMEGKVRAALRLISEDHSGCPLNLDGPSDSNPASGTVREIFMKKHPPKQPPKKASIVQIDPIPEPHPILFDQIDGVLIRHTALRMDGAAGPSGLDSAAWKRMCTSFKSTSADLCEALASIARRICSSFVDPKGLSAFVACRLIALDKCPGVRPIGIGETVRRIIGKAIAFAINDEIKDAAGPLQLCAGHISGCEAAVHAMRQVFEAPETDAVILVDASNAFNSLNRQTALRNVQHLCPALSKALINTYREDVQLFIDGEVLLSQEGTTQGDPLAMAMYAVAITPLIHRLKDKANKQVWFADDATAGGTLPHLRTWWDRISSIGPDYGYHPNASKTWLIVKEGKLKEASTLFQETGVSITEEGKRHLGAAVGTSSFVESYVQRKVSGWVHEVERLSSIASTQPHAAYAAFTHGLTSKWTYLTRTIPEITDLLQPLEDVIRQRFLPSLTGQNAFKDADRELMALPVRFGGLGIINPCQQSANNNNASKKITAPLVALIIQQSHTYTPETKTEQLKAKKAERTLRRQRDSAVASEIKDRLPSNLQRALTVSAEKGASSWLSTLPIDEHGFALHKGAFRDALCLRYGWRPSHLPSHCICGEQFTVEHALSCSRGGYPSIRHNEIRDITADLLSEVCHNVGKEPCLQTMTGEQLRHRSANREDGARLDVVAENFWGRDRQCAFFDVRVFNPFAQSYRTTPLAQCYRRNEMEKRRAYDERVREIEHGSFSPLVFTSSGGMGPTATVVYKRIASMIAEKHSKPYSRTMHWIRCRLNFSLLRSAIMSLRGSRSALHHPAGPLITTNTIDLACSEGRVPLLH